MAVSKVKTGKWNLWLGFGLLAYAFFLLGAFYATSQSQYILASLLGVILFVAMAVASFLLFRARSGVVPRPNSQVAFDVAALQLIIEDLPVALIRLTQDGVIDCVNGAARALLGRSNMVGLDFSDEIEGLGRSMRVRVEEALKAGGSRTTEMGRFLRNGNEVFLQVSLMAMNFIDRTCLVVVLSDRTELKVLEAQFVQSQKMQAVGQLAGGVAHDFNNLLTAINGHCDLLLLRHENGDGDYGDLIQIRQNANRAAALVRQLLAFSRKQTLRPKVLRLSKTLFQLSELLNRLLGEKVTLRIDIEEVLNLVRVDERQFEQVIMNLVVNARDAMLEGGEVLILAENVTLDAPLRRDRAVVLEGEYVRIRVKDTGSGIDPDCLPKIFEPFFTTKRVGEGTGLGLSTVYGIIKQTGGFVFVDSVREVGTEFLIYLPCYEGTGDTIAPSPPKPEAKPDMTPQTGKILLVEDEDPVRSFAKRALEMRGYEVTEAACAEDALEIIRKNGGAFDLYISDIIMPGKDGPTWVSEALEQYPDTGVIFMSGYAEDVFENGKHAIKNAGFLQKPFSLSDLNEHVGEKLKDQTLVTA
ncbi:MAG: ATP-binding protein [Rhodobacteraceae bacterium]|nr:ATP-binding protein [Paracoccaceae bacterium]